MPKFTKDSKYVSSNDIPDVGDTIYTIKSFAFEMVGQGSEAREKWVLYFRETKKGLVLNATNGDNLIAACGTEEMNDWVGHAISLYIDPRVRQMSGKIGPAVRIRPELPGSSNKTTVPPQQPFSIDAWITDLNLAKSVVEAFALKRKLIYAPINDVEATDLNEMADARMAELKGATA
jgi:hypothetical protein